MTHLVVMEGDGIGPEITAATLGVLRAADKAFELGLTFTPVTIGHAALRAEGTTLPDAAFKAAQEADGVVLGPVDHNAYPPVEQGGVNPSGALRKRLDLYANIRPARTRPGVPPKCGVPVDLVIVRENTEGFYADRNMFVGSGEFMPTPDVALSVRKVTREGCTRIAEAAFALAMRRRKKVTAVHKANVFRVSEAFFLDCVRTVAARYPAVTLEEVIVDAMAALLVRDASRYDVIVTTNMFGDILSDQASEIAGSLGLAASINHGAVHGVAQAQHGSAPDIAGQDRANPASLIGSAAMLLAWLGDRRKDNKLHAAAAAIESALDRAIAEPNSRTRDLGGPLGTKAFGERVAAMLVVRF
ncbi:MAG: isocitrate/isopropylmalate dehydrogenase family protein [Xanthobacteraceae bacterium]